MLLMLLRVLYRFLDDDLPITSLVRLTLKGVMGKIIIGDLLDLITICFRRSGMGKYIDKRSKHYRTMDLFARLCEGKVINKAEEAATNNVDERSIQRDIDDIRAFLDERSLKYGDRRKIVYDRTEGGYIMVGEEASLMSNSEILAVSKILLESRAFTKKEVGTILDKLIAGCVPANNMELVSGLIENEKFHYVELHRRTYIRNRLWKIGMDIHECNLASLKYARANNPEESVKRIVEPVSILFAEYYFYLLAYIDEKDDKGKYVHKYQYPAIFRIDRMKDYKTLGEKFNIPYANRFEEGEFRKRIQFMQTGKLQTVVFKVYGVNPEPILDRLPTARIIKQDGSEYTIEAEAYGNGIIMWLLSQGSKVEVIRPQSTREGIKQELKAMLDMYE